MAAANLDQITRECQRILRPEKFNDWEGSHNGLQVENSGRVTCIAAAVDASLAVIKLAAAARADLLIVHHGLFWKPPIPWIGPRRAMLQLLIESDLAVYSSHLPLDAHRALGNNAQLCASLGLRNLKPFFFERGQFLGWQARHKISRMDLEKKLARVLGGRVTVLPGGPSQCGRIGVVTGGAGAELKLAAAEGIDTFITGEGPHWTHALAEETGINVFYGGHYATETFGVKALAASLSKKFRLPWTFLDHPSGL